MIKLKNLHKYFYKGKQNEIHVINDIDLELPESGMVAIFGRSGCGKTTLLNVIGGLDRVHSGSISIDGNNIEANTDALRNKYIGYIFQNYNLNVGETCFENVADALKLCGIADSELIKKRVVAALRNVGLEQYAMRTPDTLSGGQQQRIAIARAIVKNPRIILADEPTGNLDEANTVLVMDLLKEISRDHLVLLVTHEANLVDLYCDKVIELQDGKVVSVRENEQTEGYAERGKNDIYLGELQNRTVDVGGVNLNIYGETPESPINITVVNDGGRVYLRIDTQKVQLLDSYSEVKLHEGVYEQQQTAEKRAAQIDMSELAPIEGEKFGRLFGVKDAIKSGYAANFKKRGKRGKKLLRRCLCLFAAVIVIMSGVFGVCFKQLSDADSSYNHNVFYVYTENGDVSSRLNSALSEPQSGIDYVRLDYSMPQGDSFVRFLPGAFETFDTSVNYDAFSSHGVYLDIALTEGSELLAGKLEGIGNEEVVITSAVADEIIENSALGYIDGYDDVVGMIMYSGHMIGTMTVAGVVDSDETAIYMNGRTMAYLSILDSGLNLRVASEYGMSVADGRAIFMSRTSDKDTPKLGDTVKIQGKDTVIDKIVMRTGYSEWLKNNGKNVSKPMGSVDYFEQCEEYFAYFDEYLTELTLFMTDEDFDLWLYKEKGIEEAKYVLMSTVGSAIGHEYYIAVKYKQINGVYPTREYVEDSLKGSNFVETLQNYRDIYHDDFHYRHDFGRYYDSMYYVSDADYISFSKQSGESHNTVHGFSSGYGNNYYYDYDGGISYAVSDEVVYLTEAVEANTPYTVVHSTDPRLTEAYLENNFSDIKVKDEYYQAILTPYEIYELEISASRNEIAASIVSMIVILVIMSICMYFIMRSSLMNRIKEVGIYRAIGVTKRNLVFKFFIEAVVLTTLTVFIGYLGTSAFLFASLGISSFMETMIYYPVWMALAVLGVIYAVCLFFGTLPVNMLLKKTPSEILSKYDI